MTDDKTKIPIDWPCWWKGAEHHLLEGMPFVGTHCKIIKEVRSKLSLRDGAMFDELWIKQGYSCEQCKLVAHETDEIIHNYIVWPNSLFFPDDRVALLFGVIPGVWFDSEDPVEEVRRHFNLAGTDDNDTSYYNIVLTGQVKEFMALVLKRNSGRNLTLDKRQERGERAVK